MLTGWPCVKKRLSTPQATAHAEAAKTALDPNEFHAFKLLERKNLTPNTALFRFALPEVR